jgi:hypothetical protein
MLGRVAWLFWGTLLATSTSSAAEDAALVEIRNLLLPMRAAPLDTLGPRGATPAFTGVKHRLRDWVESKLHEFRDEADPGALAHELNLELRTAKLSCDWDAEPPEKGCPNQVQPGYLGEIRLTVGETLVVTTQVGVVCGFDQSAYAYYWIDGRWKRFWQSETNDYSEGRYTPLNLKAAVSRGRRPADQCFR